MLSCAYLCLIACKTAGSFKYDSDVKSSVASRIGGLRNCGSLSLVSLPLPFPFPLLLESGFVSIGTTDPSSKVSSKKCLPFFTSNFEISPPTHPSASSGYQHLVPTSKDIHKSFCALCSVLCPLHPVLSVDAEIYKQTASVPLKDQLVWSLKLHCFDALSPIISYHTAAEPMKALNSIISQISRDGPQIPKITLVFIIFLPRSFRSFRVKVCFVSRKPKRENKSVRHDLLSGG